MEAFRREGWRTEGRAEGGRHYGAFPLEGHEAYVDWG